ncbi:MAG: NGG1p interacting factor NIF3, partial [Bacteroidetes Order II. Incertae sedis bacterium]|nr:NGG1p interacting factor NIF3 [Bacteroidetes Order II. bacterium]
RYVGDPSKSIQKVAVCGGSGSDFIQLAQKNDADVYITADVTYHRFFDVLDQEGMPDMALIDAGHYETEKMTEDLLVRWLSTQFPSVQWVKTNSRTSPVKTWTASDV